jgi:hypothetical protein
MDALTLGLLFIVLACAMAVYLCMVESPAPPPAPERVPPVIAEPVRRTRGTHPVLAQNVAVARLMRMEER